MQSTPAAQVYERRSIMSLSYRVTCKINGLIEELKESYGTDTDYISDGKPLLYEGYEQ